MDQKRKIELYIEKINEIHRKDPMLKNKINENFIEYEKVMSEQLPKFKEKYPTLFKLSIKEFNQPNFTNKLKHFLSISQNVLNGKKTLDEATKQVAQEQYDEYVAPIVKNKESRNEI